MLGANLPTPLRVPAEGLVYDAGAECGLRSRSLRLRLFVGRVSRPVSSCVSQVGSGDPTYKRHGKKEIAQHQNLRSGQVCWPCSLGWLSWDRRWAAKRER